MVEWPSHCVPYSNTLIVDGHFYNQVSWFSLHKKCDTPTLVMHDPRKVANDYINLNYKLAVRY